MRWAGHAENGNAFRKNLKGREHLGNLGMDRRIMLKCIIIEWEVDFFIWPRTRNGSGLHKLQGISWSASQEERYPMELHTDRI